MTQIIGICGRKQAGKTTLSNFLHGHEMKRHDVVERFFISPEGKLVVNCTFQEENGKDVERMGVLELDQHNDAFYHYAANHIWPLIRGYNFADSLKEILVTLFNVPPECVYGTDEQKNMVLEHLRWENMPGVMPKDFQMGCVDWQSYSNHFSTDEPKEGPMTAREFMQFFGTEVMRKIYGPVWINNCLTRIKSDSPPIAIIGDCRFVDEIKAVQNAGGKVFRLTRSIEDSDHQSEVDADSYDSFDGIIDNQGMTIEESTETFLNMLVDYDITKRLRKIGKSTMEIKS